MQGFGNKFLLDYHGDFIYPAHPALRFYVRGYRNVRLGCRQDDDILHIETQNFASLLLRKCARLNEIAVLNYSFSISSAVSPVNLTIKSTAIPDSFI